MKNAPSLSFTSPGEKGGMRGVRAEEAEIEERQEFSDFPASLPSNFAIVMKNLAKPRASKLQFSGIPVELSDATVTGVYSRDCDHHVIALLHPKWPAMILVIKDGNYLSHVPSPSIHLFFILIAVPHIHI